MVIVILLVSSREMLFFYFIYTRSSTDVFAAENTFNRAKRIVE